MHNNTVVHLKHGPEKNAIYSGSTSYRSRDMARINSSVFMLHFANRSDLLHFLKRRYQVYAWKHYFGLGYRGSGYFPSMVQNLTIQFLYKRQTSWIGIARCGYCLVPSHFKQCMCNYLPAAFYYIPSSLLRSKWTSANRNWTCLKLVHVLPNWQLILLNQSWQFLSQNSVLSMASNWRRFKKVTSKRLTFPF